MIPNYFHPQEIVEGEIVPEEIPFAESKIVNEKVPGLTSIIIPAYLLTYPIFHQTGNCIGSIREHTKLPYEIILIINGDTGIGFEEKDYAKTYADKVIKNKENLGWAKAINQGIRAAKGEYIALINNDVMVFDNWLEDAQDALKHTDLVMATPMYGKPYARAKEAAEIRAKNIDKPIQELFTDFNDFSCVVTKRELFEKIGTFDEGFFMYGEDLDFIKRLQKFGFKNASTGNPDVGARINIYHVIGMTASGVEGTPELMEKAKERLKEKWES